MPYYKMDGKKDGKQKYRVRVNYIDGFGKKRQIDRVAYGLEEAKQLERELDYHIKREKPSEKLTIKTLFDKYIEAKRHEIRESSLRKTERILKQHIVSDLENVRIDKLTAPVLQQWKTIIEQKDIKIRTKKNIFSEFRTMLNWAVKMEYLSTNPLTRVGNFKAPLEIVKEMDYYTADEFKKFISQARAEAEKSELKGDFFQWNYYVFFAIAFYMGMRKGEIHALQWSDIKDNCISVTKSLTQKLQGEDRITPPKNKSSIRTMQIPQPLIEILAEHKERCKGIEGFSEKALICGGIRALRDTSVDKANEKFAALAGIKKIRIHDFRHSHASLLANEGINIQEVARRLGHADIKMTWQTYSHLYPREEERAVNILNKIR